MFSPSSPTQKISVEASSGSDEGSEVSLEPETDRFGFILTNGSTAGCVGPPPGLVRQREAKWISIISQWDHILLKKTNKVRVQCQKGIPASLRAKCWPLLCGATDMMKQNETLYKSLDSQPALQSWVDVIERDLDRQFPFHEMFLSKDGHGQRGLFRVLKAYTQYQPEEGYCQAQGPVAAVLLMNMPAEEAFWCLVQISERYLPGYYSPLLEGVLFDAAMLTWVLKRTCPAAHKHLQQHGVEPLMFTTDWLMCLFTRHLPFNTLLRVWDLFFCFGVRVLLQVAVVLVRRVLGRAEQRRQCDGQMETLERLRGVRDQIQEEDDTFIAEVCSVQLSAKDLEKQTEKQLVKWRKDRPSSSFDPRGRCHGYRMAWAQAQHTEEEQDKREREKGNLSLPLARSASTLSLSPSLLQKWKKGGKGNTREWEGGAKVVRHLSMGAKEDCRSWSELHFKKVKEVQEEEDEDIVPAECKKQSESNLRGQTAQKELLEVPEKIDIIQNIPAEHEEETVIFKEQAEHSGERINEEEKSHVRETEQSKQLLEQTGAPPRSPAKHQSAGNILNPSEDRPHDQQCHRSAHQETEVKEENNETAKQTAESEQPAAVEDNKTEIQKDDVAESNTEVESGGSADLSEEQMIQSDMKPEESSETEDVQQMKAGRVTEVSETTNETSPGSETDSGDEAQTVKDPVFETEIHQQQEGITEKENSSQEDAFQGKHLCIELLAEEDVNEESCSHAETETGGLAYNPERVETTNSEQIDSETETASLILCLPECIDSKEGTELEANSDTEEKTAANNDTVTDTGEAFADSSEKECDPIACEHTKEEISASDSEEKLDNDQTQAEETTADSRMNEECADFLRAQTNAEKVHLTVEVDEKTSPSDNKSLEEPSPEEPVCVSKEEESIENPQTNAEKVHLTVEVDEKTSPSDNKSLEEPSPEEPVCVSKEEESIENPQTNAEKVHLTVEVDEKTSPSDNKSLEEPSPEEPVCVSKEEESIENPQTNAEKVHLTVEVDEKTSPSDNKSLEEPAPEEPVCVSMEEESIENVEENTAGGDDVFGSTDSGRNLQIQDRDVAKDETEPSHSGQTQACERHNSKSSGDLNVFKSSVSRRSWLGRRLSEDLFVMPQKTNQSQSITNHQEVQPAESKPNPIAVNPTQPQEVTSSLPAEVSKGAFAQEGRQPSDPPKRFGLFRRLKGEQSNKAKAKRTPKIQVPKILIQDFSDGTEMGKLVKDEDLENLSSRERRRRRREQERKEKEEERLRKKRERELEKERERERRRPKTSGKSSQVHRKKGSTDEAQPAKTGSEALGCTSPYAQSYF
ncbi:rab GTPase-activating protein eat-17 isoform X2 [Labrus bergylta]|uniref:rab GTPase-activating protein eat-17 isoform X2 n=1 Tax=Labrus bergylta TaxID=56723 RepID=UPI003313E32C